MNISSLDKILVLPPVEDRKMIGNPWRKKMFGEYCSPDKNDMYVFYLVFKRGIIVGFIVSLALMITHVFDIECHIGPFEVCVSKNDFVRNFSWSFSVLFLAAQLLIIFPFFYTVFRRNIDWQNYDFLKNNKNWNYNSPPKQMYVAFRRAFFCTCIGLLSGGAFAIFVANRLHAYDSEIYLLFLGGFLPFLMSIVGSAWFSMFIVFQKSREFYRAHARQSDYLS